MNNDFFARACGIYFNKIKSVDCLGVAGVQIFFVISGYLIAFRYVGTEFNDIWRSGLRYAIHKLKKFYILHIITFAIFLTDMLHTGAMINPLGVILNLTLTKAWYPPLFNDFNGVSWFLSAILFIYLLMPFTVRFFASKTHSQLVIILISLFFIKLILETVVSREISGGNDSLFFVFYPNPIYRYIDFLFGFIGFLILGDVSSISMGVLNKRFSLMQIFFMSTYIIGCIFFNAYTQAGWLPVIFLLLSVFVVHALAQRGVADYLVWNAIFVNPGNISFYLYLLHFPIMLLLPRYIGLEMQGMLNLAAIFLLTLIASEIFHKIAVKIL